MFKKDNMKLKFKYTFRFNKLNIKIFPFREIETKNFNFK